MAFPVHGRPRGRRHLRGVPPLLLVLLLCALSGGCSALLRPPAAAPASAEEIARLEADLARDPADVDRLVALGIAYRSAGRAGEAGSLLERALEAAPDDPAAVLHLGLSYEDLERFDDARALYSRYLEVGSSRVLKSRLRGRIALLERQSLRLAIRGRLAEEASLARTDPDPRYVAVFPFTYEGPNEEYRPLSRALAELLTTDLAQTSRITVLERVRGQILLDELKLAESGLVDPATAARSGYLLGAGRIVHGRISGVDGMIRLQAEIVNVGDDLENPPSITDEGQLRSLFDLEKRLALSIYTALGVELTAAERERIDQRPTESLQALLAYGLGLQAADAGDYATAASHFARAVSLDANFQPARARAVASREVAISQPLSTSELTALASTQLQTELPAIDAIQGLVPVVGGRDAGAEVLGNEGVGRQLILEIIIRRPGQQP